MITNQGEGDSSPEFDATSSMHASSEQIMGARDIEALIDHLADALYREYSETPNLALVGIQRRGDAIALRIQERLARLGMELPCGALDITLYRDDFDSLAEQPVVGKTHIPFSLDERTIILVDDVLFTGRTIRAALDELVDLGRPTRIVLLVLIDRGWRELPIAPDFVGKVLSTAQGDDVQVHIRDVDERDEVILSRESGDLQSA